MSTLKRAKSRALRCSVWLGGFLTWLRLSSKSFFRSRASRRCKDAESLNRYCHDEILLYRLKEAERELLRPSTEIESKALNNLAEALLCNPVIDRKTSDQWLVLPRSWEECRILLERTRNHS